jgi:hypothetical protein
MSLTKIGSENWDFVDAEGCETRLPEAEAPAVPFPTRWRVFGPLEVKLYTTPERLAAGEIATAAVKRHTTILDTLEIGNETLEAQDVDLDGDTLDLGKDFGGYETVFFQDLTGRNGQQAYAFAELELDEETEVTFGAGTDFWMQWWIDGAPVYDTLENGNETHPPSRTDHVFSHRLSAGRHLLAVWLISGQTSWILKAGVLTDQDAMLASVTFSDRWQFLPDIEEIRPPRKAGATSGSALDWGHTMGFAADRCLADETIECDFQMGPEGNFGIILGAQDSGHYYSVQVPRWGQLWRARGFWVCICKADGSGHLRILKMQLMPNVVCHWNAWLKLRVERRGNRIQAWVDGVKGPCVTDDSYGPGRPGLTGFAKYIVRNLKIDGQPVDGPAWKEGDHRGKPWLVPVPETSRGDFQLAGQLLKLSDDEVLLVSRSYRRESDPFESMEYDGGNALFLSRDSGRTWSPHGIAKDGVPDRCFVAESGRLRVVTVEGAEFAWSYRDSTDAGLTWSEPVDAELLGDWQREILRDGTWNLLVNTVSLNEDTKMGVILHGYGDLAKMIPNQGEGTWGTEVAQPYCTLSTDRGRSWSEPVPMDNAALNDGNRPDGPCGGFSETSVAQLPGGRIVALARPFHSPFMWQTHSDDGGKSWRMCCYAPFSGSGDPQLIATRSGYLVSVKRGPALCLHISTDGGVNWDEGTIIDYPAYFNGSMIEVEPDMILVIYPESQGEIRPSYVRAQLIRITPEGPVPVAF